jgi:hypothetical protein
LLGLQNVPGHRWSEPTSKEEGQTEPYGPTAPKAGHERARGGPKVRTVKPLASGPAPSYVLQGSSPLGKAEPLSCPRPHLVSIPLVFAGGSELLGVEPEAGPHRACSMSHLILVRVVLGSVGSSYAAVALAHALAAFHPSYATCVSWTIPAKF